MHPLKWIRSLWDWLCSWSLGWYPNGWYEPTIPLPIMWAVIDTTDGHYRLCFVYNDELKARNMFTDLCREHPEKYFWLIEIHDIHRPNWRGF